MSYRRDIRRLAMQVLYQLDVTGLEAEREAVGESLDEGYDPPQVREPAVELALKAWGDHEQADGLIGELTPEWPTHRQPPVDRALLRLGYYEMVSGHAPVKVAINEHVELAKRFSGEGSASFINGVLDKMARRLGEAGRLPEPEQTAEPAADEQAWLDDAEGQR